MFTFHGPNSIFPCAQTHNYNICRYIRLNFHCIHYTEYHIQCTGYIFTSTIQRMKIVLILWANDIFFFISFHLFSYLFIFPLCRCCCWWWWCFRLFWNYSWFMDLNSFWYKYTRFMCVCDCDDFIFIILLGIQFIRVYQPNFSFFFVIFNTFSLCNNEKCVALPIQFHWGRLTSLLHKYIISFSHTKKLRA